MSKSKTTPWVLGTLFLALVMAFGSWTFLVSPRLAAAEENRAQAESEQMRIDQLQIELAGLKKDFENIDAFRADLAALRVQIPAEAALAELTRQLSTMATDSQVAVLSITSATPIQVASALPTAPAPAAPVEGEAAEGSAEATAGTTTDPNAAAAPAPVVGVVAPPNMYAIPFEVRTVGSYANTVAMIQRFQTGNPRLLLIRTLSLAGQQEAAAQGGRPAVAEGDPEMVIQGYAYVLTNTPVPDEGLEEGVLPTPSTQESPFTAPS